MTCRPLLSGRLAKAWPGQRIESRILHCHALVLVDRGRGHLAIGSATWEITAGTVFLLRAGTPHSYSARPRWTEAWVTFHAEVDHLPTGSVFPMERQSGVASALRRMVGVLDPADRSRTPGASERRRLATAALNYILAELAIDSGVPEEDPLVAAALALVAPDPGRWTPQAVATALGVSYPTLRRRWRGLQGMSVQDWLVDLRLERGRQVLVGGGTVAAAAEAAGFAEADGFTRRFTARMGLGPRDYRRSCC